MADRVVREEAREGEEGSKREEISPQQPLHTDWVPQMPHPQGMPMSIAPLTVGMPFIVQNFSTICWFQDFG
jgi:hypothetical protein